MTEWCPREASLTIDTRVYRGLILDMDGVEFSPGAALLTGRARVMGLRAVVVTSSKNGGLIMQSSGLLPLFDALVDSNLAATLSLRGKPHPDLMLESSRRMYLEPEETVLFEDSVAGVQSGKAAGIGLVVGVARDGNEERLRAAGADEVVRDLAEVMVTTRRPRSAARLPRDGEAWRVAGIMAERVPRTVVLLDYDGTLTPIAERPELARLDPAMRDVLARLSARHTVAVVSGRSLEDVRAMVGLEGLFYAGSHGLELAGPEGEHFSPGLDRGYPALMDEVEAELHESLDRYRGLLYERKPSSLAIHYRLAAPEVESRVVSTADRVLSAHPGLRRQDGKKVVEVRPDIDWDKGKALTWLLEQLGVDFRDTLAIYIGDDKTDEDAFRALQGCGLGILVWDGAAEDTYADLTLRDTADVREFLESLLEGE